MFDNIVSVAHEIHQEVFKLYWILLPPLVIFLIILEVVKGKSEQLNPSDIIRRVVISMVLLVSFDFVIGTISTIGDGILSRLDKYCDGWEVLKNLGPDESKLSGEWFNLREHFLYFLSLLAYFVAYIGFFAAEAITYFLWSILYILSPLMILAYVAPQTAGTTKALYKSLVKVIIYKVLWMILAALLLAIAKNPQFNGFEDYFMSVILNLCIGASMLFVPIFTKSLINDGLDSAAGALATLPAAAASAWLKAKTMGASKKLMGKGKEWGKTTSKPLTNPLTSRAAVLSERMKPRLNKLKEGYANAFQTESYKKMKDQKKRENSQRVKQQNLKQRRKTYAIRDKRWKVQAREISKHIKKRP